MCSSNGVMTWRPLRSTGSLGMVPPLPRYYGTLRLPAVRLDPFEFFTSRYHRVARGLLPSVVGRPTGGQGVVGSGLPIRIDDGNVGVSQVPWKPWWSLSVLFDPGRIRQAERTKSELPDTAPACVHGEGSKRLVLSGLNHTTFDLTVYASQDGSPHHHARLASGCWSSFARRDSYPQGFSERFQSSSLFLPSKAYLTQAGWPQGIAPLGLPRIRTCPFRHTALHIMSTLRDGSLSESAIRLVPDSATVVGSCTRLWVSMHPPCVLPTVS